MKKTEENWHSREGALNLVFDDDQRVQYDGEDGKRIYESAQMFAHNAAGLITVLSEYNNLLSEAGTEKDTSSEIAASRAELIEALSYTQMALSKIAWTIRTDMNEAYAKLINSQLDSTYPLNFKGM